MRRSDHCTGFWPTPGVTPAGWGVPPMKYDDSKVTIAADPGFGSRKGVIILCHPTMGKVDRMLQPPHVPSSSQDFISYQDFANTMATQGWMTIYPILPLDYSPQGFVSGTGTNEEQVLANLAVNDAGHGSVFRDHVMPATLDHLVSYLEKKFNKVGIPLILMGYSLGAYMAAIMALHASPTVLPQIQAFISHELPTLWQNVAIVPAPFSGNTSGIDLDPNAFDTWTKLAVVGYSANDGIVGYSGSASPGPISNTQSIIANAPSNVIGHNLAHAGVSWPNDHLFLTPDVTYYSGWINTNITAHLSATF